MDVVAVAGDATTLLDQVRRHRPDVVVTDIQMPPDRTDDGLRAAQTIHAAQPLPEQQPHQKGGERRREHADRRERATAVGGRGPADHHGLQRSRPQRRPHRPRDHVRQRGEARDLTPPNEVRGRPRRRPIRGHRAGRGPRPEVTRRRRPPCRQHRRETPWGDGPPRAVTEIIRLCCYELSASCTPGSLPPTPQGMKPTRVGGSGYPQPPRGL